MIPVNLFDPRVLLGINSVMIAVEFSLTIMLAALQEKLFIPVLFPDVDLKANPLVCNKHIPALAAKPAGQLPHNLQTLPGPSPKSIASFSLVQNSDWNEAEAVEPISHWLGPQFSGLALP